MANQKMFFPEPGTGIETAVTDTTSGEIALTGNTQTVYLANAGDERYYCRFGVTGMAAATTADMVILPGTAITVRMANRGQVTHYRLICASGSTTTAIISQGEGE